MAFPQLSRTTPLTVQDFQTHEFLQDLIPQDHRATATLSQDEALIGGPQGGNGRIAIYYSLSDSQSVELLLDQDGSVSQTNILTEGLSTTRTPNLTLSSSTAETNATQFITDKFSAYELRKVLREENMCSASSLFQDYDIASQAQPWIPDTPDGKITHQDLWAKARQEFSDFYLWQVEDQQQALASLIEQVQQAL
jgi:uncharacterized protein YbaA (DUF1428 family)